MDEDISWIEPNQLCCWCHKIVFGDWKELEVGEKVFNDVNLVEPFCSIEYSIFTNDNWAKGRV